MCSGMLRPFAFRGVALDWSRPYIMGVVNVTPDSFSDGGALASVEAAVAHGERLVERGADVIDVGGEATNPRAKGVTAEEEIARVIPVIEGLVKRVKAPISVDTTKAAVAKAAIEAGAEIVNDVSGGLFDPATPRVAAASDVAYICGHLRGRALEEVFKAEAPAGWEEVANELDARIIQRDMTWVDPGLGFGKGADPACNMDLIRHAGDLAARTRCPVVLGPSRKRFLAKMIGSTDPKDLDAATVGACLAGVAAGANMLRVHDPGLLRAALVVYFENRGS